MSLVADHTRARTKDDLLAVAKELERPVWVMQGFFAWRTHVQGVWVVYHAIEGGKDHDARDCFGLIDILVSTGKRGTHSHTVTKEKHLRHT